MFIRKFKFKIISQGITSFGRGCGRVGVPGVYTNINDPDILGWIHMALDVAHTGEWGTLVDWIHKKKKSNQWRIIPGLVHTC